MADDAGWFFFAGKEVMQPQKELELLKKFKDIINEMSHQIKHLADCDVPFAMCDCGRADFLKTLKTMEVNVMTEEERDILFIKHVKSNIQVMDMNTSVSFSVEGISSITIEHVVKCLRDEKFEVTIEDNQMKVTRPDIKCL
jgi:hypothetical protein